MKITTLITALGLAALAVDAGADPGKPRGPGGPGGPAMERLKQADTNADGMISRDEAKALPIAVRVVGLRSDIDQLAVFWPTEVQEGTSNSRTVAEVTFPLRGLAVHELVAWSAQIAVVSPSELRAEVVSRLDAAKSLYGRVPEIAADISSK